MAPIYPGAGGDKLTCGCLCLSSRLGVQVASNHNHVIHNDVTGLDEEAQLQVRNYDPVTTLEVFLVLPVVPCDRRAV